MRRFDGTGLSRAVERLIFLTIISRNNELKSDGLEKCERSSPSEFRGKCIPDNATARNYFKGSIYENEGMDDLFSRAWKNIEMAAKKNNVSMLDQQKPLFAVKLARLKWELVSERVVNLKDRTWTEYCPREHAQFIAQLMQVASFDQPTLDHVIQLIQNAYHLKGLSELMETAKKHDSMSQTKPAKKHDSKSHLNCDAHAKSVDCDSHIGCGWDKSIEKCQEETPLVQIKKAVIKRQEELDKAQVKQEKLDKAHVEQEKQNSNGREDALDGRAPPSKTPLDKEIEENRQKNRKLQEANRPDIVFKRALSQAAALRA